MRVLILLLSIMALVVSKPQPKPEPKPQFSSNFPFNYPLTPQFQSPYDPQWSLSNSMCNTCYPDYGGGYSQGIGGYLPQQTIYGLGGWQQWNQGGQQLMSKKTLKNYITQLEKTLADLDKADDESEETTTKV